MDHAFFTIWEVLNRSSRPPRIRALHTRSTAQIKKWSWRATYFTARLSLPYTDCQKQWGNFSIKPTLNLSKATFQRVIVCFWIFLSWNLSANFPSSLPVSHHQYTEVQAFTELTRVVSTDQMHLPWFSNQHAGSRPAPDVAKWWPSSSNPSIYLQLWDPSGWRTRWRRQPSRRPVLVSSSI